MKYENHLINHKTTLIEALEKINNLQESNILFVIDSKNRLMGTLTDGDIRRSLITNKKLNISIDTVMNKNFKFLNWQKCEIKELVKLRDNSIKHVPFLNNNKQIAYVIDLNKERSFIDIPALIMAGGIGQRLRPLTEKVPKPLLKIGNKPILQYNIEHLVRYGIKKIYISIKYLGDQIQDYFKDGSDFGCEINYINEVSMMGTIGAAKKIEKYIEKNLLILNSDILTNINYEAFYLDYLNRNADISIASIPYQVSLPYAVIELSRNRVSKLIEKPDYNYMTNAGIYLMSKKSIKNIPRNIKYNATTLIEKSIDKNLKVISYPIGSYWLDIGKHDDYIKAQSDIKYIRF